MDLEQIFCPVQTRSARMYEDPEPAEHCENEVENYGDLCPEHDADDRADADYENYLENLREQR